MANALLVCRNIPVSVTEDPNLICPLDPDPASECQSGSSYLNISARVADPKLFVWAPDPTFKKFVSEAGSDFILVGTGFF